MKKNIQEIKNRALPIANEEFKSNTKDLFIRHTDRKWLIIQVQRYKEEKTCDLLNRMKIEFFLPGEKREKKYGLRNISPIIPMTIFINISQAELSKILKEAPFCRYLRVPNQDAPFILSNYQVKEIKSANLHLKKIIQIIDHLIAENKKTKKHLNV
ncbi:MAG: hypothetical protein GX416_08070 [Bacteroidales bacterium]|nr:hypothetical protein [Bacteroidales bacterium]